MIEQIFTLGRTGPEQSVRRTARTMGIQVSGGKTRLELTEMAGGTLILFYGDLPETFQAIQAEAESRGRSCLHIDLGSIAAFGAARRIAEWIRDCAIESIHIACPDGGSEFITAAGDVLTAALRLSHVDAAMPGALALFQGERAPAVPPLSIPQTVNQAVETLTQKLNFKERTRLANMSNRHLLETAASMERYFVNEFRLWVGNDALADSCRDIDEEKSPSLVILEALRDRLGSGDALRVVK